MFKSLFHKKRVVMGSNELQIIPDMGEVTNRALFEAYHTIIAVKSNIDYVSNQISDDSIQIQPKELNEIFTKFKIDLSSIVKDVLIFGYSILEVDYEKKSINNIKMSLVGGLEKDEFGNPIGFYWLGTNKNIKFSEELIFISPNNFNKFYENSLVYPLVKQMSVSFNNKSYSFNIVTLYKACLYAEIQKIIKRANEVNVIDLNTNMDPTELQNMFKNLMNTPIITTNAIKDVKKITFTHEQDKNSALEYFNKIFSLATNSSHNQLLSEHSYTEASANIAQREAQISLEGIKRSIEIALFKLVEKIAVRYQISTKNLDIRIVEKPNLTLNEMIRLYESGVITKEEIRTWLKLMS